LYLYDVLVRRTHSKTLEGGIVAEEPEGLQEVAKSEESQEDAAPDKPMTRGKLIYLAVAFVVFGVIVFFMLKDIIK
jgi:hypothetical protein